MPRKTLCVGGRTEGDCDASMRPRPDAAENEWNSILGVMRDVPASMRPRPDAAENPVTRTGWDGSVTCFNEAAARCRGKRRHEHGRGTIFQRASMRPRPDAAENARRHRTDVAEGTASMRPRPDAAENCEYRCDRRRGDRASMRPRPDAAENAPELGRLDPRLRPASMRPRPDAAENFHQPPPCAMNICWLQ